jgi:hypothetical protein
MGNYLLEYTRCEGDLASGGVDNSPNARCIQVNDGRPIYKQEDGPNYLYYHKDEDSHSGVWVVDMTDDYEDAHMGLQVKSKSGKPEDISETWQMATKDKRWTDAPTVKATCGGRQHSESNNGNYQVTASFILTGMSAEAFGIKERKSFITAIADTLDVPVYDVSIANIKNYSPNHGRRLGEDRLLAGSAEQIEIDIVIVGSKKQLQTDVLPKLEETLFSTVLQSELKAQELSLTGVEVMTGSTKFDETPGAKIHDALVILLTLAMVAGAAIGAFVINNAMDKGRKVWPTTQFHTFAMTHILSFWQTHANLDDITAEEKRSLVAGNIISGSTGETEEHEDL